MILQDGISTCFNLPKTLSSMNCIPTANDLSSGWMLLKNKMESEPAGISAKMDVSFPGIARSLQHLTQKVILHPNHQGPQAVPVYISKNDEVSFIRAISFPQPFLGLKNLPNSVRDREELS